MGPSKRTVEPPRPTTISSRHTYEGQETHAGYTWRLPFGLHESPKLWKDETPPSEDKSERKEVLETDSEPGSEDGEEVASAPSEDTSECEEVSEIDSEPESEDGEEVASAPRVFVCDEALADTWWARERRARLQLSPRLRPRFTQPKVTPTRAQASLRDKSLRNGAYERGACTKLERDATILASLGLRPTPKPAQEVTARDAAWIKLHRCIRTTRLWLSRDWDE